MKDRLGVVLAELTTLSYTVLLHSNASAWACTQPFLILKTWPRFCPSSWSLSMHRQSHRQAVINFTPSKQEGRLCQVYYFFGRWSVINCNKIDEFSAQSKSNRQQQLQLFICHFYFIPFLLVLIWFSTGQAKEHKLKGKTIKLGCSWFGFHRSSQGRQSKGKA
jgi:hypothetical protein